MNTFSKKAISGRANFVSLTTTILFLCFLVGGKGNVTQAQTETLTKTSTPVEPTWESINQHGYPDWFRDAKLGIFIHWGLYSIPAYASPEGYGEWFYKGLISGDEGRKNVMRQYPMLSYATPASWWADTIQEAFLQYANLRNYWHAEKWNPAQWAKLFRLSGARYVLLVTKHHDGYCLWDYPRLHEGWNSVATGPHRNIVADLTEAVRNEGLKMGFYYSLTEWTNPIHTWTLSPNDSIENYVSQYMIPQFKDLVTRYKPSVIFTDGEWDNSAEQFHARDLISWYYNQVPDGIVNDRWGSGHQHGFRTPEYSAGILDTITPWAECRGIGRSFGINHNENIENYISSEELIQHFVQLVAAGGGLTLNVGPEADGTIPLIQQKRLLELGKWLTINGAAIYGTRSCPHPFEYSQPLILQRNDSVIHFNWVRNAPMKGMTCDHFEVHWEGDIVVPATDKYQIQVEADDDVVVLWDNDTLLYSYKQEIGTQSNAQQHGIQPQTSTTLKMKKGERHHVEVLYKEQELEAGVHLQWSTSSLPLSPIPAEKGYQGQYSCLLPNLCYTQRNDTLYAITLNPPFLDITLHNLPEKYYTSHVKASFLPAPMIPVTVTKNGQGDITLSLQNQPFDILYKVLNQAPGAWAFELTIEE